jgi:hypothetical protein
MDWHYLYPFMLSCERRSLPESEIHHRPHLRKWAIAAALLFPVGSLVMRCVRSLRENWHERVASSLASAEDEARREEEKNPQASMYELARLPGEL